MKPFLQTVLWAGLFIFVSCNTKLKEENAALKGQIDSLQFENQVIREQGVQLQTSVENYKQVLSEIHDNLSSIKLNQSTVKRLRDEELTSSIEDQIKSRIFAISELVVNSKMKIMALDKNLNELRKTSSEQSEQILELDRQLKEATAELLEQEQAFNEMTATFELELEDLEQEYEIQLAYTEVLRATINRAFWYAGTADDLKEKGIVTTEGGFIGIGRTKVLNANSTNQMFNQVGKDVTDQLTFAAKEIKIISEHPEGTYSIALEGEQVVLSIQDRTEFWRLGNYLVVQLN